MNWIDVLNHHLWTGKITELEHDESRSSQFDSEQPPLYILPTPQLIDDLDILEAIFQKKILLVSIFVTPKWLKHIMGFSMLREEV